MVEKSTQDKAWDELDHWRLFGANTRLAFTPKQRLIFTAASAAFRVANRLICGSSRWTMEDPADTCGDAAAGRRNFIFVCWHNRLIGAVSFFERTFCRRFKLCRIGPMVSESFDGEVIARVIRDVGGENIRGSSSHRAAEGLREAVEEVRRGLNIVVTADGPKGPRYELKPGVILLAKLSGAAIVPMTWECNRTAQFHKSWDQLMVPLPFARFHVRLGKPITVSPDADARGIVAARREVEAVMAAAARQADLNTAITWQIPKPRTGQKLKRRKEVVVAAARRV